MRFLPTDFHLDLHQASTAHSYSDTTPRHGPHAEPFALLTPLSPPPPPLLLCLPLSGQRQQPQTEHSGGPLGDPSARVFEVFLIVGQSVSQAGGPRRGLAEGILRWQRLIMVCKIEFCLFSGGGGGGGVVATAHHWWWR